MTTIYVGGFDRSVDDTVLHAAFIPFGEIENIEIPSTMDKVGHTYGFIRFSEADDALAAIENMDKAELNGKIISVAKAKSDAPLQVPSDTPLWQHPEYFKALAEREKEKPLDIRKQFQSAQREGEGFVEDEDEASGKKKAFFVPKDAAREQAHA